MNILVIAAMDIEINELAKHFKDSKNVSTYVTGVGMSQAASFCNLLKDVDICINVGVAGSLKKEVQIGKVYTIDNVIHHDIDVTSLGLPLGELSKGKVSYKLEIVKDLDKCDLATGSKFISDISERLNVGTRTGCTLVDMETSTYASVCKSMNTKFISLRSVSDTIIDNEELGYNSNLDKACKSVQDYAISYISSLIGE